MRKSSLINILVSALHRMLVKKSRPHLFFAPIHRKTSPSLFRRDTITCYLSKKKWFKLTIDRVIQNKSK